MSDSCGLAAGARVQSKELEAGGERGRGRGEACGPQSLPSLSADPRAPSGAPAAAEGPAARDRSLSGVGPPRAPSGSSPGGRHRRATPAGQGHAEGRGRCEPRPGGSAQAEAAPWGPRDAAPAAGPALAGAGPSPSPPHGGSSCVCS